MYLVDPFRRGGRGLSLRRWHTGHTAYAQHDAAERDRAQLGTGSAAVWSPAVCTTRTPYEG